ncbi:MAG: DUF4142 domain-containing protein [Lacunisphaera sp.]
MNPTHSSRIPVAGLALLLGLTTLPVTAQSGPVPGNPPHDQPSTPNAPLPSRPAEDFKNRSPAAPAAPSEASERVLVEVARLSAETNRLSQIATDRAAHVEVRDFAGEVTSSSQALTDEIKRMAAARNVAVHPDQAAAEDEQWEKKAADRFEESYLQRACLLHEGAIAVLEGYAGNKEADPEIAAVAKRHLPGLHKHLRQAENLDELLSRAPSSRRDEESIAHAWPGRPGSRPVVLALRDESVD